MIPKLSTAMYWYVRPRKYLASEPSASCNQLKRSPSEYNRGLCTSRSDFVYLAVVSFWLPCMNCYAVFGYIFQDLPVGSKCRQVSQPCLGCRAAELWPAFSNVTLHWLGERLSQQFYCVVHPMLISQVKSFSKSTHTVHRLNPSETQSVQLISLIHSLQTVLCSGISTDSGRLQQRNLNVR